MERYRLQFATAGANDLSILVPFASSSSVRDLKDEAVRRLARTGVQLDPSTAHLRLDSVSGPLLDGEDVLSSVVLYPARETLVVVENILQAHDSSSAAERPAEVDSMLANFMLVRTRD